MGTMAELRQAAVGADSAEQLFFGSCINKGESKRGRSLPHDNAAGVTAKFMRKNEHRVVEYGYGGTVGTKFKIGMQSVVHVKYIEVKCGYRVVLYNAGDRTFAQYMDGVQHIMHAKYTVAIP